MEDVVPDILDRCLARLADGATVDECLSAFPERQAELELPLRMAARLRSLPRPALPPAARANLETQMLALAGARRAASQAASAPQAPRTFGLDAILAGVLRSLGYGGPLRQPWLRLAAATIAIALVLTLGAGTLAAARAIVSIVRPQPTAAPTVVPSATATPLVLMTIDGPIEQIAQEGWVVGGTTVVLTSTTAIEGTPALGASVQVRGVAQEGGALLANSIVVAASPTPTSTPAATHTSTPTAAPAPTATPAPTTTSIPMPTSVPPPSSPGENHQGDGSAEAGDNQNKPCQGLQLGRDEKKCDPKPREDKQPPKPPEDKQPPKPPEDKKPPKPPKK
jgi:hypothetical protein